MIPAAISQFYTPQAKKAYCRYWYVF